MFNPTDLAKIKVIVAALPLDKPAKNFESGVVKAKHLRRGQIVRPFLHGEPKGSERVVDTVLRLGPTVSITFSSPHPPVEVKAAYRYHDASIETLVGIEA